MALLRAVAETDQPFAGMADVVGRLFFGFGCDAGKFFVTRSCQGIPMGLGKCRVEKLTDNGVSKVTVFIFNEKQVAILMCIAQKCQCILIPTIARDFCGMGKQGTRLTDQVQADVGQGQFFFNSWRLANPFGHPVPQNQI